MKSEILVDSFYGSLRETYNHINKGRIFLTNIKIIACGYPIPTGTTSSIGPKSFYQINKDMKHMSTGASIRKSMNKSIKGMNILPYGYHYPIYSAHKIKKGKSAIRYRTNMKVYISPGKMNDRARKEEILSNIEKMLIQNQ